MNKKHLLVVLILLSSIFSNAQIKGVTETGDEVLLFNNGTWRYASDSLMNEVKIEKNFTLFKKDEKSSFLVKSDKTNIGLWINPKEWSFSKADNSSASEYEFSHKTKDLYAMILAEKTEIPIESLIDIAFENAAEVSTDVEVVKKEYRNVNGLEVIMMQLTGTIQGIKFYYYGYYYSNSEGAYQLLCYTSQNLFNEYEEDMLKLLNGMVEY